MEKERACMAVQHPFICLFASIPRGNLVLMRVAMLVLQFFCGPSLSP